MGTVFWVKRFLAVFSSVFLLLLMVEFLKNHSFQSSIIFAATWFFLASVVFVSARLYQSKKAALCIM